MEGVSGSDRKKTALDAVLLGALFASGAAALIYEIAWMRALSLVVGSTTYAISTMLAAFMSGLALGAYVGGIAADRTQNKLLAFGIVEAAIAVFGLLTFVVIRNMEPFYVWMFYKFRFSFHVFFVTQFVLAFFVMLVPTTLMGMTFPLALKGRARDLSAIGRDGGGLYSINSLGAVAGSLAAGFVLIPLMGIKMSNFVAAGLNIAVAVVLIIVSRRGNNTGALLVLIAALGLAPVIVFIKAPRHFDMAVNFYRAGLHRDKPDLKQLKSAHKLVYEKENAQGVVQVFSAAGQWGNDHKYIATNGKIEGSVARTGIGDAVRYSSGDWANQLLLAYLPLEANPGAKSFFNIGLGTGATFMAALGDKGIERAVCVDIQPLVYEAVEKFFFPDIFKDARAEFAVADARNYLSRTTEKYDIISSEPSYPTDEGMSNLFSVEFFELVRSRLNEGGVFAQWLPGYLLTGVDEQIMIRTFGTVFKNAYVWSIESSGDVIMIGAMVPFGMDEARIKSAVAGRRLADAIGKEYRLWLMPEDVRKIVVADGELNTDDRPYIEFVAARSVLARHAAAVR
ncbi:MAG: fused MFS/spermidine synthase [Deltaproteobacteria bacterium]|nr:fused MFS/spermidine synthase [Deltaproteobacteria bacterium]